ncbi:Rho GTPase activation protein [Sporodiniella umbellata]|nr:Rho GTPase activation protein [Sporodiniella umbellata]
MVTGGIFGAPLKSASMCGSYVERDKLTVPEPVYRCFEEIMSRGLQTEGIFRLSGATSEIEQLCLDFDSPPTYGKYLDLKNRDIHAIASVAKKYLRQLPDPAIPMAYHDRFLRFFAYSRKAMIRTFALMIQQLPREHFQLLLYILILASHIQKEAAKNLMNPEALAVILAPACTGLEQNLKETWVKRRTKRPDIQQVVQLNLKWTRLFTLLIEYSDTLIELWKETVYTQPVVHTVPCRPSFTSSVRQPSLVSLDRMDEQDPVLPIAPKELYKVVILRPRYTPHKSQKSIHRASLLEELPDSIHSLKSSVYSRSSVSLS